MCYVGWLASETYVIWKSVSFAKIRQLAVQLFQATPHVGWAWYESLSGFLIVLQYLVFITLLYFIIVLPCVGYCSLYVFLPTFWQIIFWVLFIMCTLGVIDIALDDYAIICHYWCWPDMLSVACDSPTSYCNLYGIWSVMVIVVSLPNNHHGPLSSHWTTTVDPMGMDAKTGEASFFVSFLFCLCSNLLWYSSTLSLPIVFLSMTGITPCTRQLNSSVVGLSKPYPSGVVWICNNAMWMSPPESAHF